MLPQTRQKMGTFTLSHEIGHMLNFALDYKVGSTNIKNNWEKINDKKLDNSKSHISEYAKTNYREDFAETFAYMANKYAQAELFVFGIIETIQFGS